jgi:hypothetical protein
MAGMSVSYLNAIADAGANLIKYIGLVDESDEEISGGSPAYARKAVTWTSASGGTIRPSADLTFDIPSGKKVAGWRGYSAATNGTNYGGKDLTQETFAAQGQYKLLAANTGIKHENPA